MRYLGTVVAHADMLTTKIKLGQNLRKHVVFKTDALGYTHVEFNFSS